MKDIKVKSDQKQNSATMLMTEGKIWKQLLVFAVPLILGNLLQQMYNAVDSIIVGNYVGSNALAAVGSSNALINLLIAFAQGASVGAGVVISQFLGAGDTKRVHRAVHTAATIALLLGVVLTGAGIALSRVLLMIRDQIYILDFYFAWNGSSKRCILRLCLQIFEQFLHLCFAG